ncbi:MAG: sodium:solute symporter, partial [Bacteroidota bacterium]
AFGMIGATLSGVTFISTPGTVGAGKANMNFSYMQMVFGYLVGYYVIATVLMPLYYRMNLTTIYGYFRERFGTVSYRTGAGFFLLSRIIGASFRLFLVAIVLQNFVLGPFGIPLWMTVALTILLIWIYTFQGGIKTIVWTDTLQTTCLLASVMLTILAIGQSMDLNLGEMWAAMGDAGYTEMWYFEGGWGDPNNFFKQFIGGALLAIVMTGMDQDMMQKNLTCKSLSDAQKNMFTFSIILVFANVLFLSLGAMLYIYAGQIGMAVPERPDLLFPQIALTELGPFVGLTFIVGLIAAAYSSADSALTALTTSFCVDFLDFETTKRSEATKKKLRIQVHIVFSIVLFFVIILFDSLNNDSILNQLFRAAGYTYGPILGLFSFGMLTSRLVLDRYALAVCLIAPVLSFMVDKYSAQLFGGFSFGFMILALNGLLTFCGLWLISSRPSTQVTNQ